MDTLAWSCLFVKPKWFFGLVPWKRKVCIAGRSAFCLRSQFATTSPFSLPYPTSSHPSSVAASILPFCIAGIFVDDNKNFMKKDTKNLTYQRADSRGHSTFLLFWISRSRRHWLLTIPEAQVDYWFFLRVLPTRLRSGQAVAFVLNPKPCLLVFIRGFFMICVIHETCALGICGYNSYLPFDCAQGKLKTARLSYLVGG